MTQGLENQKKLGKKRYHIVRYEDLVSNTEKEMLKICDFLEIDFNEQLCIPTENGNLGMADSMYEDSRVVGRVLDQSKSKRWESELTEKDKTYVISLLYSDAIRFGYDEWEKNNIRKYKRFHYEAFANIWGFTKPIRARFNYLKDISRYQLLSKILKLKEMTLKR